MYDNKLTTNEIAISIANLFCLSLITLHSIFLLSGSYFFPFSDLLTLLNYSFSIILVIFSIIAYLSRVNKVVFYRFNDQLILILFCIGLTIILLEIGLSSFIIELFSSIILSLIIQGLFYQFRYHRRRPKNNMPPPIPIHYDIRTVARTIWPLFMPIIVTNFIISTIGYHMGVKIVNEHNNLFFILFFLIFYITPLWLLFVTLYMLGRGAISISPEFLKHL